MVETWEQALKAYRYPVNLAKYESAAAEPPGWFEQNLSKGDRSETITFENRFRSQAQTHIEAWYEVVFWKNYSFGIVRDERTVGVMYRVYLSGALRQLKVIKERGEIDKSLDEMIEEIDLDRTFFKEFGYNRVDADKDVEITAERLWDKCLLYIEKPSLESFQAFRNILFKNKVIATAATFPAFLKPDDFPMVDRQVARWARENGTVHDYAGCGGPTLVTRPDLGERVLTDRDWDFVQSWIEWCRFTAERLTDLTGSHWRARDAEMAVYTAQTKRRTLEPLCGQ